MASANQKSFKKLKPKQKSKKTILIVIAIIVAIPVFFVLKDLFLKWRTLSDLDDPMIAKDVAGLELKERFITPPGEFIKRIYPEVNNYYAKPSNKTDKELSSELMALAVASGWLEIKPGDSNPLNFSARKGRRELGVSVDTVAADNLIAISIKKWD